MISNLLLTLGAEVFGDHECFKFFEDPLTRTIQNKLRKCQPKKRKQESKALSSISNEVFWRKSSRLKALYYFCKKLHH